MQESRPDWAGFFSFSQKALSNEKRPLGHLNLKSCFFGRTENKTLGLYAQKSIKTYIKGYLSSHLYYSAQSPTLQNQKTFVTSNIFRCKYFKMIVVTKKFSNVLINYRHTSC